MGVAVSGGPDSLALLLLANAALPGRIAAATVDHGLRAEAADEATLVASVCAELGVPHKTVAVALESGNLQAEARAARYSALGEWARSQRIGYVATAHHLEDQAETVLMRLARGSGVFGLAGMCALAPMPMAADIGLLRPLLGWRKEELGKVVAAAGLVACADPSNHDLRFDRSRVRQTLDGTEWLDARRICESAGHLSDAVEAMNWAVDREFDENVEFRDGYEAIYRPKAPKAIRLEVVRLLVENLGMEGTPRGGEVARFLKTLEQGGIATLGGMRGDGRNKEAWEFTQTPPRRP